MHELPAPLQLGTTITVLLANGASCQGELEDASPGWLRLRGAAGIQLIQLAQVAVITTGDVHAPAGRIAPDGALPRPKSNDIAVKAGSRAPGRAWTDDDLRRLADAFLDQRSKDGELAARFNRARVQIGEMRRGFECARGNLVEDQISPIAATWVGRWRRVLTKT